MGVALYRFDAARSSTDRLEPAGFIKSDVVEPYGFCMGRVNEELVAVLIGKDGQVRVYKLSSDGAAIAGTERFRFAVGSQSEGCAVDDEAGQLYIGEEAKGVWRYPLAEAGSGRELLAGTGDGKLVADVEGVTLIRDGGDRYLLVSSQGDSAFAVWRVSGAQPLYTGRFHVGAGSGVDEVTGTDGIDARGGAIGSFRSGLIVVQDDQNDGGTQNFKLLGWGDVRKMLETAR
jgi:3-phytase